jgi:predicted glycosyltransferase involved in capsule biosynthesis
MGNYKIHEIEKFTYLYYFGDGAYSETRTEWREVGKEKRFVVECMASVVLINKRYFTLGITGGANNATWFLGYFNVGIKL